MSEGKGISVKVLSQWDRWWDASKNAERTN